VPQAPRRSTGGAPRNRTVPGHRAAGLTPTPWGFARFVVVTGALLASSVGAVAGPTSGTGGVSGIVTDRAGEPLGPVLVTASGPSGTTLVLGDGAGEYTFSALAPGEYLLRAHRAGFAASRLVVEVRADSVTLVGAMRLRRAAPRRPAARIRMAGAGLGVPVGPSLQDAGQASAAPDDTDPGNDAATSAARDGSEASFWRLRRTRRSVLKSRTWEPTRITEPERDSVEMALGRGPVTDFVRGLPVSGEVRFLTRATLDGPRRWRSATGVPPGEKRRWNTTTQSN
jgi:hypothetical protein